MAIQEELIRPHQQVHVGDVDLDRDRELVVRYQHGEVRAFDELYRRYYERIHGYCLRRVGNRHVAEELAQEAFLRALRAMPRFAGERRFYPWMTVIAQRLCIDHHRRAGRTEPTAEISEMAEPEQEEVFTAVHRDQLTTAIANLAPRHRDVLALREERSWSYQQIADHMGVPVTTVEALLHRARKALRREFLAVNEGRRRPAAVPIAGALAAAMSRLRPRIGRLADTGWIPQAVGPAAAGVAAVGLVLAPMATSPSEPARVETQRSVVAPAPGPPAAPAATDAAAVPVASPVVVSPAAPAPAPASTIASPTPAADLVVVEVSYGPAAVAAADATNAAQPLQVDLGIIRFGLDPAQLVQDLLQPGIGGTP